MSKNNDKKEKRGMYLALSLCLLAIGVATLGTYLSLSDFVDDSTDGTGTLVLESSPLESEVDELPETDLSEESEITNEENPVDDEVNATLYTLNDAFMYPVENFIVITDYSEGDVIYNEVLKDYRVHNGTDFSAEIGDNVKAMNNGVVTEFYNDLLLGNVIVIEHGDYEIRYCGLDDEIFVNVGDVVTKGTIIGTVDIVPCEETTTHVHVEILLNGEYINPLTLNYQ